VKAAAGVMTIVSIVLAASFIVIYFNLKALIQQQSEQIEQQKEDIQALKDALMSQFNYEWHNAPLPEEIKLNATAQRSYFQLAH
jgi:preprotein translocase subunit SecG